MKSLLLLVFCAEGSVRVSIVFIPPADISWGERAGDEDRQIKSKSDPALWGDFISSVPCSDFLPKDNRAFADDSFLKQQRDQCWVARGFLRKTSQNAVCTCVRVFLVVAAQGDKETHSGPVWLMYYFRYSQSSHSRRSPEFGNCSHAVGKKRNVL